MRIADLLADPQLWPTDLQDAAAVQVELAGRVRSGPEVEPGRVRRVAGLDVTYSRDDERLVAAAVVLDAATLQVVESAVVAQKPQFPYVPGLFAFRELPPLLAAVDQLEEAPDAYLCDGFGLAHPRRFGLACHLGVLLDRPAFGVAKSALTGTAPPPGNERGSWSALRDGGDTLGRCLRTQDGVKPVYVSVGHRATLADACALTLVLSPRYRIPEPIRRADQLSRAELAARR